MKQHLLRDLDERTVRRLKFASGSSRIASSAYQKWPTKDPSFNEKIYTRLSSIHFLTYLKFENRVKPGKTLVEARSGTDVQIVRLTWV